MNCNLHFCGPGIPGVVRPVSQGSSLPMRLSIYAATRRSFHCGWRCAECLTPQAANSDVQTLSYLEMLDKKGHLYFLHLVSLILYFRALLVPQNHRTMATIEKWKCFCRCQLRILSFSQVLPKSCENIRKSYEVVSSLGGCLHTIFIYFSFLDTRRLASPEESKKGRGSVPADFG
jgi:hypothetical protein